MSRLTILCFVTLAASFLFSLTESTDRHLASSSRFIPQAEDPDTNAVLSRHGDAGVSSSRHINEHENLVAKALTMTRARDFYMMGSRPNTSQPGSNPSEQRFFQSIYRQAKRQIALSHPEGTGDNKLLEGNRFLTLVSQQIGLRYNDFLSVRSSLPDRGRTRQLARWDTEPDADVSYLQPTEGSRSGLNLDLNINLADDYNRDTALDSSQPRHATHRDFSYLEPDENLDTEECSEEDLYKVGC